MLIARLATAALFASSLPAPPNGVGNMALTARLCGGSTISIPLDDNRAPLPEPCPLKACHAGSCRRQFDRSQ